MDKRPVMAMLIVILLLALNCLLITGNPLDKEIAALRIKIEQQDAALRWLENVTQTQNEKIASLNEQLQQGLEERDLEIDIMQNESGSQQEQLEKLQEHLEEHNNEIDMMQNESSSQKEQLEKLQEDFEEYDVEIDVMLNESSSQKEQLKNLQEHLEEHDDEIDMMQNASNIQEEQLENLTADNRKLHDGNSLLQQQVLNTTDTLNAKLQHALDAKVQNETDNQQKLIHNLTEIHKNMWKDIQTNHNDTSKLNNDLVNHQQQLQSHQGTINSINNQINTINGQLEYGGRREWKTHKSINSGLSLRNYDYVRLEFMGIGATRGWLGCPDSVCDLRRCPYNGNNIRDFNSCHGELFRIVVENGGTVESGERVRFLYATWSNYWLGCPHNNRCDKRPCPGSLSQGTNFNNGCTGETFKIYARGKRNGQTIYNGDLVMINIPAYGGRYISIQGSSEGADTSMNYCPGEVPPAYLSYSFCSNNVFRIYKKP